MNVQAFGFIVVFAGMLAIVLGDRWIISFAFSFTVFGAAAGISLPVLGGATITPPHLFLAFLIFRVVQQRHGGAALLEALTLKRSGGWLVVAVAYGLIVSALAPSLFPDILVYAFSRGEAGVYVRLEPLNYGSSLITQGVYAIGAVLLIAAGTVLMQRPKAAEHVLRGIFYCTLLNLLFVVVDLVSYYSGSGDLLSFVRTGDYAQLYQFEGGLKRIAGSFTEPSAFAAYSCVLLGFWSSLWMQRFRSGLSGLLALATLCALLLSTSSTAYVAVTVLLTLLAASDMMAPLSRRQSKRFAFIVAVTPVLLFCGLLLALFNPAFVDAVAALIDETVFNKANSGSGVERLAWSTQAWQNFVDTYGIGIGIGGARASGYVMVLLSNIGLVGTAAFGVFVYRTLSRAYFHPVAEDDQAIGIACRWAFAGGLISSAISAGVFELGALTLLTGAAAGAIGYQPADSRVGRLPLRRPHDAVAPR